MRFFKKLKTSNIEEAKEAILGFGIPKAMDYTREKYGHLILVSFNLGSISFLKKFFIPL